MVIGMDVREAAGRPAGKGRVARELMDRLPRIMPKASFRFYTTSRFDVRLPKNAEWREVPGRGFGWHYRTARLADRECDVYLAPTSYLTPQFLRIPFVLIVHDLIAFQLWGAPRRARTIERLTLRRALSRAAQVLTNSEATSADLNRQFPRGIGGPVTAMPLAADPRFRPTKDRRRQTVVRQRYGLDRDYILFVGTIEPRKNLVRLVEAYAALPAAIRGRYDLVLVGKRGWQYQPVFNAIAAAGGESNIRYLDYVPDDDLTELYGGATVFCYPSRYEGFGLPVLEAMQSGRAVVTSKVPALEEVGGPAIAYADPEDTGSITRTLEKVLTDPKYRSQLESAGRKRAGQFTWERAAKIAAGALNGC